MKIRTPIHVYELDAIKSFVMGDEIVLQTETVSNGVEITQFVSKNLSDVPSWFPCEQAVEHFIERNYSVSRGAK